MHFARVKRFSPPFSVRAIASLGHRHPVDHLRRHDLHLMRPPAAQILPPHQLYVRPAERAVEVIRLRDLRRAHAPAGVLHVRDSLVKEPVVPLQQRYPADLPISGQLQPAQPSRDEVLAAGRAAAPCAPRPPARLFAPLDILRRHDLLRLVLQPAHALPREQAELPAELVLLRPCGPVDKLLRSRLRQRLPEGLPVRHRKSARSSTFGASSRASPRCGRP